MKKRVLPILALTAIFFAGAGNACAASPGGASPQETSAGEISASFSASHTQEPARIVVRFYTIDGQAEERTLRAGESLDLSAIVPERADADFLGWYFDEALTLPAPLLLRPEESLTLYAKWRSEKHVVSFETFGGGEIPPLTGVAGEPLSPPEPPVKEGFVFAGWYADREYRTKYVFTDIPAADLTLYAKWLQKDVEVRLYLNSPWGGELAMSLFFDEGELLRADAVIEAFRRRIVRQSAEAGGGISYRFRGWAYDAAGSRPFDGEIPRALDGIDLYAIWSPETQPGDAGAEEQTRGLLWKKKNI